MSKGPGTVERAIRALLAASLERIGEGVILDTVSLCEAAFGTAEPTKAQRVSALRAMHRIMAAEPGWTTARSDPEYALLFIRGRQRRRRLLSAYNRAGKPWVVDEPILAYQHEGRTLVWGQAVIVSRGGKSTSRVTIEYNGRRYQGHELEDGRILCRQIYTSGIAPFCHERARAKVEEEHERRERSWAEERPMFPPRLSVSPKGAAPPYAAQRMGNT